MKFSKILALVLALTMGLSLVGCKDDSGDLKDGPTIRVASKPWTEQLILGSIFVQYLEGNGYPVKDRTGLGETPVIRPALHSGQVDLYCEYTGTTLILQMDEEIIAESEKAYEKVKSWDKEENDVVWLDYSSANNTYTLLMREDQAEELEIETISDLADYINSRQDLKLASVLSFVERLDGLPGVEEIYGFDIKEENIITMAEGLTYGALKDNQVDISVGYSTDGRIKAFNLRSLEDDKGFFPAYNIAPLIRQEILEAYPELEDLLNKIPALLDNELMRKMNNKVDVDGMEPEDVAEEFLLTNNLIEE